MVVRIDHSSDRLFTCYVTPCLKRVSWSESNWSLSEGLLRIITDASMFLRIIVLSGALRITLLESCVQGNLLGALLAPSLLRDLHALSPYLKITLCFADVIGLARTKAFVYFASWVWILIFDVKQLFNFSCWPLYHKINLVSCKRHTFLKKTFNNLFIRVTKRNFNQYEFSRFVE